MYRENIYDIMWGTGFSIAKLVIPKNSGLKGYAWKVLKEAGLDLDKAEKIGENELRLGALTILLRRGEDIPQIVMSESRVGNVILGLTGDDLLDEYRLRNPENMLKVENTYDWYDPEAKFLRPALSFMNIFGNVDSVPLEARVAINAKYEYYSRLYLSSATLFNGTKRKFVLEVYSGDLEATVAAGANDCCIDTVYSGKTIDKKEGYGLRIIEIIRFSDLVIISPLKKDGKSLLELMAGSIQKGPIIKRH